MSGAEIERTSELLLLQGTHVLSCLAPQAEQGLGLGNQNGKFPQGKGSSYSSVCLTSSYLVFLCWAKMRVLSETQSLLKTFMILL